MTTTVSSSAIPDFLQVHKPHQSNPCNTELGHTTTTERALYTAIRDAVETRHKMLGKPLTILDACCASGGCAWNATEPQTTSKLVLLDNDPVMCRAAESRPWKIPSVTIVQKDAVNFRSAMRFDIILANSAYHHIDNEHKVQFLHNMANHLTPSGSILVGEHFLPDYCETSLSEYRKSVVAFYSARIESLLAAGDTSDAIDVIRQTGRYCWERQYEHQVSQRIFREHIEASSLKIESMSRLWPASDDFRIPINSGTFLISLKSKF